MDNRLKEANFISAVVYMHNNEREITPFLEWLDGQLDFNFKKSLGQNFLRDKNIVNKIIEGAEIDKDTLVIEIGPGDGSLSYDIINKCGYAYLFEIDNRLEDNLRNKLSCYSNYTLYIKDFLESSIDDIKELNNYKKLYVVANLPYYITSPIIMKLVNEFKPDKIVIMIQKEVAMRLSASVNTRDYGYISVILSYYYDIKRLVDVSRKCFIPEPKVDSAVIVMNKRSNIDNNFNYELFLKLVKDAFQFKRKNLRNNLKSYDLDTINKVLEKYNLSLTDRAENISLDVFIDIVNILDKKIN